MKKVEYLEKIYDIPEKIEELTVEQFIEIYLAILNLTGVKQNIEIVRVLTNMTEEEINNMPFSSFSQLSELCHIDKFEIPKYDGKDIVKLFKYINHRRCDGRF